MNQQRETEVTDITQKHDKVQIELDNVRSELSSRLKAAEDEVSRDRTNQCQIIVVEVSDL